MVLIVIKGTASIQSENSVIVDKQLFETENIIIATGSKPNDLDGTIKKTATSIQDLLKLDELPKSPIIVGCNPHAVELVQFFNLIGTKVVLIATENSLIPDADKYLSDFILNKFKKAKIDVVFDAELKSFKNGILITNKGDFNTDCLINASDRKANIPDSKIEIRC